MKIIDNNNRLLSRNEMYLLCLTERLHVLHVLLSFTFERNENLKQIQHLLEKYVKIKYYQEIQGLSKIAAYCRNHFIKME